LQYHVKNGWGNEGDSGSRGGGHSGSQLNGGGNERKIANGTEKGIEERDGEANEESVVPSVLRPPLYS